MGFLNGQQALLRFVRADEIGRRARVQFGAAHVETGGQEIDLVLCGLHSQVGLHLDDFLVGLGQLGLRLVQDVLLIGGIEFRDDVAGAHGHPGLHQLEQPQAPARRRGGERHRPAGAQLAVGEHVEAKCTPGDRSRRHATRRPDPGDERHRRHDRAHYDNDGAEPP